MVPSLQIREGLKTSIHKAPNITLPNITVPNYSEPIQAYTYFPKPNYLKPKVLNFLKSVQSYLNKIQIQKYPNLNSAKLFNHCFDGGKGGGKVANFCMNYFIVTKSDVRDGTLMQIHVLFVPLFQLDKFSK